MKKKKKKKKENAKRSDAENAEFIGAVWIALNFAASTFSHFFFFFFNISRVLQNRGTNNNVLAM